MLPGFACDSGRCRVDADASSESVVAAQPRPALSTNQCTERRLRSSDGPARPIEGDLCIGRRVGPEADGRLLSQSVIHIASGR